MHAKLKYAFICIICMCISFGAGYFICTKHYTNIVNQLTAANDELTNRNNELTKYLADTRRALDGAIARSVTAERGLTEAITSLGTIQDRNKRIEVLIAAIKATVRQLRDIITEGAKVTEAMGNSCEN